MDDDDLLVGQIDARIVFGDARIVPGGDLAEVDVGQHVGAELEIADARDVEDRDHSAEHGGNVDQLDLGGDKLSSVMGMSEAPKSTRPAVTWRCRRRNRWTGS